MFLHVTNISASKFENLVKDFDVETEYLAPEKCGRIDGDSVVLLDVAAEAKSRKIQVEQVED